jgi:enoyl-CoA hydratase/carnithine racemase
VDVPELPHAVRTHPQGPVSAAPLRLELDEAGVLVLTLNRPEVRNALDDELTRALSAALNDAASDPGTRAIILTGAGESFCAGGDLGRFEREWTPSAFRLHSHRLTALIEGIEQLEKPVIAAINGVVTGAGTQLALACDIRLAATSARIIFREGRLGIIPSHGGITRLVKLVGLVSPRARARRLTRRRGAERRRGRAIRTAERDRARWDSRAGGTGTSASGAEAIDGGLCRREAPPRDSRRHIVARGNDSRGARAELADRDS